MPYDDELVFEHDLVEYLREKCGWTNGVIKNPSEKDLIENWANILYENNNEVDRLNGYRLTDGEMKQILDQVESLGSPYRINSFINGKSVTIIRDNTDDVAHFNKPVTLDIYDRMKIAAGNSRYQIAEQPRFKTANNIYPNRRGDIMLLINGMPVYHIELKKSNVSITQAEIQIEKYMVNNAFRGIFSMVQIFVAMNPEEAVYFANPGVDGRFNPLYYFHWTDSDNKYMNEWHQFAHSLLMIPRAHEMIGFYAVPDSSDGILKVLRPYQYHAAYTITQTVSKAHWTKQEQKGGYIWHTTGSGKTLTSFKTAQLIANMCKEVDKVVFLVDRVELGEQSFTDYVNYADIGDSINDTDNTDSLIRLLKSDNSEEKIIISSIQKMSRIKEGMTPQSVIDKIREKKIVFIVDECHRDQNGDMHQDIEHTFPTAMFFGFTGTPDHDETVKIFGDEKHRYSIADGIRDGSVLGFDPYEVYIYDDKELRSRIGLKLVNADSEDEAMASDDKREAYLYYLNQGDEECPMTEIEKHIPVSLYKEERYKREVVKNILKNWRVRSVNSLFHAIFATGSIPEAIEYYRIFVDENRRGGYGLKITALFDPSDDNGQTSIMKMEGITEILTDYDNTFDKSYRAANYSEFKKDLCERLSHKERYKNIPRESQLNLVIVVDQLLTGFDSKWINTIYLDKVLRGKSLIQAASRTNRLYGHEKKHGTIIMYRYPHTMKRNLEEAVDEYSGNRPFEVFVNKLKQNLLDMNSIYDEICEHFESVGITGFEKTMMV
ncbi:MAG: type I restriction endonuclease subunit R [Lachnospiraceae bacterium]|nr:type I restriction endonuclease subunit R [Lachnospiraceae bacterium]